MIMGMGRKKACNFSMALTELVSARFSNTVSRASSQISEEMWSVSPNFLPSIAMICSTCSSGCSSSTMPMMVPLWPSILASAASSLACRPPCSSKPTPAPLSLLLGSTIRHILDASSMCAFRKTLRNFFWSSLLSKLKPMSSSFSISASSRSSSPSSVISVPLSCGWDLFATVILPSSSRVLTNRRMDNFCQKSTLSLVRFTSSFSSFVR
mmetsp:Transcript_19381/g.54144  ORF Transcript_19381/g.54144 Transcript_19381/m.54144 type:complete len:210 (+) Transcript_19381:401-1030(+)